MNGLGRRPGSRSGPQVGLLLAVGILLALATSITSVVAADPTATTVPSALPGALSIAGDTRSDGGGPGLVGSPLLVLVGVIGLGLATAGVTLVLVRLRDPG